MVKFLQHRIGDRRILRLIKKRLRAGVLEDGEWSETEKGTPQGSVISPLLANVYLHYVFDLWVQHWRKHRATGEIIVVPHDEAQASGKQREECGGSTMGTEVPGVQLHESQATEEALGAESGGAIQGASSGTYASDPGDKSRPDGP